MTSWVEQRSGCDEEAITARQAEIIGKPQRIAPLENDEMSRDARDLIDRIRAAAGSSPVVDIPGYFRTMVKHPEIFRCQLDMGAVLFKGALPARERELAILRCGWLLRAPYEWGEHVNIGKRYGLTKEEVARTIEGSAAAGWSEHDAAILSATEQLLADQTISDETWATLAKRWDEQQLIEFPMMVGQYVATALVQNALRIRLGPNNPGLTNR